MSCISRAYAWRWARDESIDIELHVVSGEGRRGHFRLAFPRERAVPRTLRNDSDYSGAKRKELGRSLVADNFQGRSAVEDVDQLVGVRGVTEMTAPLRD